MLDNTHTQKNKGISLIIALFTMTLMLSLSFSIGNIIMRQFRIINTSVSSQTAFYAADSALECAIYWDIISDDGVINIQNPVDDTDTYVFGSTFSNPQNVIQCGPNGAPINLISSVDPVDNAQVTTFAVDYSTPTAPACASVTVHKLPDRTLINTLGYNAQANSTGCDLTKTVEQRVVERGLRYAH